MNDRTPRKKIPPENPIGLEPIPEEVVFGANKCSLRAKKIVIISHGLSIEIWFDQHYFYRHYHGDEKGKREGIDPGTVESLVTRSIANLFWYSTIVSGFNFVNYEATPKFEKRVVLKETLNASILNVVIEVHFLSIYRFEVTVITAMIVDNFRMAAGQFCIELRNEHSILKKLDHGKVLEICNCNLLNTFS